MTIAMPRWPRRLRWLALLALFLATGGAARPLAHYVHRAFGAADGAPSDIESIAQTRDGMLWLGAATGVYTFDGLRFLRQPIDFKDTPGQPYFLRGDPRGGLWIGWTRGGITHVRQGEVRHFDDADGIPGGAVWGFDFDQEGGVWAAAMNGVARFDGRRWRRMGPADGFDATRADSVSVDPDGNVGVFTDKGMYLMRKGAARFDPPRGRTATRQPLAIGPQGRMYFMQQAGIRRIASLERYDQPDFPWLYRETATMTGCFLADRDGGLWFDSDGGLHHVTQPERRQPLRGQLRIDTETIRAADGLSGRTISHLFEDDRGDVWVATEGGLDRFRPSALVHVDVAERGVPASNLIVATGPEGSMWLRNSYPRPAWLRVDAGGRVLQRFDGVYHGVGFADGGRLLTATEDGSVQELGPGGRRTVGARLPPGRVRALARDRAGTVWVSVSKGGVWRSDGGAWQREGALPAGAVAHALHLDPGGALWVGYDNLLARLENGRVTRYPAAPGTPLGPVTAIARVGPTLWVAGARGVNVLRGARLAGVETEPGLFDDVLGLLADARGGLWLSGRAGLLHLAPEQVRACAAACPATLAPARHDEADGMRGRGLTFGNPQLALDTAGRVWTATTTGVYRIDPQDAGAAPAAPQPLIVGASAAGKRHDGTRALLLPAGTHDIQVDYTAPVPDTPERVRFRYRLQGYDRDWQDARTRRQAFYTGLGPGRYRFEVAAALDNGAWSARPASLAFEIAPAFYQAWWFRVLCAALALALLALLYALRVRRLARRLREQAEARHQERERIARDLHDTVLQTNYALLLQLQAVAATAGDGDPLARRLDAIAAQAAATLTEGRDKVAGLRAQQDREAGLAASLRRAAEDILRGSAIGLRCVAAGTPWPLDRAAAAECLAIACEAIHNACKHAQARTVRIDTRFGMRGLDIVVADDGRGIAPQFMEGRPGHWGLAGMRERAALIKARLDIDSGAHGTTVRLHVKRRHAGARPSAPDVTSGGTGAARSAP